MAASSTSARAGNALAVTHGAQSPVIVAARTRAIVDEWTANETLAVILTAADTAAVYATAAAYARLAELTEYLEAPDATGHPRGSLDSRGRPRGCMRLYFTAYREVMSGLRQLGMLPAGRAEMVGSLTQNGSLAAKLAAARRRAS